MPHNGPDISPRNITNTRGCIKNLCYRCAAITDAAAAMRGAVSTMCGGITAAMTGAIRLLSVWKISCAEQTAKIVNQSNAALT